MATTWRAAPSVARALAEATERWPGRNRASDGIIGDAAHSARESDHNPDQRGVVHAFDLTHDPGAGVDCGRLAEHLRTVRDRRVRYVIWSGRLYRGPWSAAVLAGRAAPWHWEPYMGANPHNRHMHVSVGYSADAEHDLSPWWDLEGEMTDAQMAELKRWIHGEILRALLWLGGRANSVYNRTNDDGALRDAVTLRHVLDALPDAGVGTPTVDLAGTYTATVTVAPIER